MAIRSYTRTQVFEAQSILEHYRDGDEPPAGLDISAMPTLFTCEIFTQGSPLSLADLESLSCEDLHLRAEVLIQPHDEDDFDAGHELVFLDHPINKIFDFGSSEGVIEPHDESIAFASFITMMIKEGFIFNDPYSSINPASKVLAEFLERRKADALI